MQTHEKRYAARKLERKGDPWMRCSLEAACRPTRAAFNSNPLRPGTSPPFLRFNDRERATPLRVAIEGGTELGPGGS